MNSDISGLDDLLPILRSLAEKVSRRMKATSLTGRVVVLKLKTAEFRIRTRNARLDGPTNLADRIYRSGRDLLRKEADGTRFRLIGIGVSQLVEGGLADDGDLIDPNAARHAKAEFAMDDIRARFGADHVGLGLTFAAKRSDRTSG